MARRPDAILCTALFVLCLLAAYPVSRDGYVDDFSYARTALDAARTGRLIYNGWAAPIQGWLPFWGALFIRGFRLGFSFNVLRLAMLPIAAASVYLFHRILTGFGITRRNAVLGTLTLALTPNFFPLSASFMTDVPGLFALLVCIVMCQRATSARKNRATALWLLSAAVTNLILGSVRQTSWLGALVMVPATGWLLRRRHGVLPTALAAAAVSARGVAATLRWADAQPYFFREPSLHLTQLTVPMLKHLSGELLGALLCLLFLLLPITAAWLPAARKLPPSAQLRIALAIVLLGVLLWHLDRHGELEDWLLPWLLATSIAHTPLDVEQFQGASVVLPLWLRLTLSALTALAACVVLEHTLQLLRAHCPTQRRAPPHDIQSSPQQGVQRKISDPQEHQALWILGPFTLVYLLLLLPRAAFVFLYDRYLLCLLPVVIVALLLLYQRATAHRRSAGATLPSLSVALLAVAALFTVGATHDFYANQRAQDRVVDGLVAAGVPRTAISQSMAADGWQQLTLAGHMTAYMPRQPLPASESLDGDCPPFIAPYTPALHMQYFLVSAHSHCVLPTAAAPFAYRTWLPPFDRLIYIDRMVPRVPKRGERR